MMNDETILVSSEYLRPLLDMAPNLGLDIHSALSRSKLSEAEISELRSFVALPNLQMLISELVDSSNTAHLGLSYGESLMFSNHGMAGIAAMTQLNMKDLLKLIERVSAWAFPPIQMKYVESGNQIGLTFTRRLPLQDKQYKFLIETIVSSFNKNFHYLFPLLEFDHIGFAFPEPMDTSAHERCFNCKVTFNEPESFILGNITLKELKLPLANQETAKIAEESFYSNTPPTNIDTLPEKILNLIRSNIAVYKRSDAVAEALSMSPRTLRRKLGALNITFRSLLDQARKETAMKMLRDKQSSLTDIAMALDFSDSSAFSKAFRAWTGMSAREFSQNIWTE